MAEDVVLLEGVDPKVAAWCVGLDRGLPRIFTLIQDLGPDQLARVPQGLHNSIATLVMHVAANEVRMGYRIADRPVPADLRGEFLLDQPQNPLPQPCGETAQSLRAKAEKARAELRRTLARIGEGDLDREISFGPERVWTVRLALSLLPTHQMWHYGQMQMIRQLI